MKRANQSPEVKSVTVRLEPLLHEQLATMATQQKCPLSRLVSDIVTNAVRMREASMAAGNCNGSRDQ